MIGVPIGRFLGIEVRVQLGWVIILALVGVLAVNAVQVMSPGIEPLLAWGVGAALAVGFFISSAAHDLVHAVVARSRGVSVSSIAVSFFGGATPLDPSAENPRDDLAIAASGPLASLAIAGACGIVGAGAGSLGNAWELVSILFIGLMVMNLIPGALNLVPAYPLDGGRIVRALAWRRTGSEQSGWRAAALTGRLSGFAAVALGLLVILAGGDNGLTNGAMLALSGWFLVVSARAIRDRLRVDELIGGMRVSDAMESTTVTVQPGLTVDTFAAQLLSGDAAMTAVPVTQGDDIVGLVGVRQVQRLRPDKWASTRVEDVMVRRPRLPVVNATDELARAVATLHRSGLDGLPVVDGRALAGILSRRSVGRLVSERMAVEDRHARM